MAKLELAVQEHFARLAATQSASASTSSTQQPSTSTVAVDAQTPFARVDNVTPESPAESAGLKVGDEIVRFGSATWINNDGLRKLAEVVSQFENVRTWRIASRCDDSEN
jgi:26S proteasome non-ATPase regulatory subunit 9